MRPDTVRGEVEVPPGREIRVGDRVEVDVKEPNAALAAFLLLGLPMVMAGVGALAGWVYTPRLVHLLGAKEVGMLVGCILGFVAALGLARWVDRRHPGLSRPRMRLLEPDRRGAGPE